jgi:cytidine deaminase
MKDKQLYIQKNLSDLNNSDQQLIAKAKEASTLSYAPYSNFHVGAALLLENGKIVLGANQENASYSLSICAERSGLFNAAINHPEQIIKKMAIIVQFEKAMTSPPVPPCGACRQVLLEYESKQESPIELLLANEAGLVRIFENVEGLLPLPFRHTFL